MSTNNDPCDDVRTSACHEIINELSGDCLEEAWTDLLRILHKLQDATKYDEELPLNLWIVTDFNDPE